MAIRWLSRAGTCMYKTLGTPAIWSGQNMASKVQDKIKLKCLTHSVCIQKTDATDVAANWRALECSWNFLEICVKGFSLKRYPMSRCYLKGFQRYHKKRRGEGKHATSHRLLGFKNGLTEFPHLSSDWWSTGHYASRPWGHVGWDVCSGCCIVLPAFCFTSLFNNNWSNNSSQSERRWSFCTIATAFRQRPSFIHGSDPQQIPMSRGRSTRRQRPK